MYNNPYQYPTYNTAFSNPYMQQQNNGLNSFQSPQQAPHYEIPKVNGKNGAEMFQMSPNSQVLLLDETSPIVWVKSTDSAGFATCKPYKIEAYEEQAKQDADINAILASYGARIGKIEEKLYEQQSNFEQYKYATNDNESIRQSEPNQKPYINDQRGTESASNVKPNRK